MAKSPSHSFKVGDAVQLKNGPAPVMTVTAVGTGEELLCVWFAGKKREHAYFPADALKAAKPDAED